MRNTIIKNNNKRVKRALRVRKHLRGTAKNRALSVVKTNNQSKCKSLTTKKVLL